MSKPGILLASVVVSVCAATLAMAQTNPAPLEPQGGAAGGRGGRGGGGGRGATAIPADYWDGAMKDTAPAGFDKKRDNITPGKLERVDYDADAVAPGLKRWMEVYTPAGYDKNKKYPILILLHGIGGNEQHEWTRHTGDNGAADLILDNLIADKKIEPMIVIFPNGNATAPGAGGGGAGGPGGGGGRGAGGRGGRGAPAGTAPAAPGAMGPTLDGEPLYFVGAPAGGGGAPGGGAPGGGAPGARGGGGGGFGGGGFGGGAGGGAGGRGGRGGGGGIGGDGWGANFTNDLMKDILPYMEKNYSVFADRDHRAIAGLSMGGGQSLNIGLTHLDDFAWVGAFSNAPNTQSANQLIPDPAAATKKLSLLWIGCGDADQTVGLGPYNFHKSLLTMKVPHTWYVDKGGHTMPVWKENLYLFAQKIFRPVEPAKP
jgi:enterochelin esterase-like enzyme